MKPKKTYEKLIQWLDTGIFPATILFSNGFGYDELVSHLKKTKADQWLFGISEDKERIDDGNWFGLHRDIEDKKTKDRVHLFYIILKKPFDFSDYDYCKLAHEVLHICQFMLPHILNRDREFECEAYLHTHIMMQCLKHLRGK